MRRVTEIEYQNYTPWARANTANRVYPCSMTGGFQSGDIYVNDGADVETVLFWHYCGFAYISGTVSGKILGEILNDVCFRDRRRMLLITDDDLVVSFFRKADVEIGKRIEYEYTGITGNQHTDFEIKMIDSDNIHAITGRMQDSLKRGRRLSAVTGTVPMGTANTKGSVLSSGLMQTSLHTTHPGL